MGVHKTMSTTRRGKKSETEELADAVKMLEKASLKIYELGVPLRDAFKLTTQMPRFHFNIFYPADGYFASPIARGAFRSACWKLKVQEGVDDENSCYVHLVLGPYQGELSKQENSYKAWLTDRFIVPFNFRPRGEEIGQGEQYYIVYHSTLSVPRASLEQVIHLLCVPKAQLLPEHEEEAFALLESHF